MCPKQGLVMERSVVRNTCWGVHEWYDVFIRSPSLDTMPLALLSDCCSKTNFLSNKFSKTSYCLDHGGRGI